MEPTRKRLVRVQKGRKVAGICSGFGEYFNVDPTIIRLIWVLFILLGGAGILLYIIAWIVMPMEDNPHTV